MLLRFSRWAFLSATLCLVAPSLGEGVPQPATVGATSRHLQSSSLPDLMKMAKYLRMLENTEKLKKLYNVRRVPPMGDDGNDDNSNNDSREKVKRKFPEVDSKGFDEGIFDEGFGEWSPMKRW